MLDNVFLLLIYIILFMLMAFVSAGLVFIGRLLMSGLDEMRNRYGSHV